MARGTTSRTSVALALAALAHVALFAIWRGSSSPPRASQSSPVASVPVSTGAEQHFDLSTVRLVSLPSPLLSAPSSDVVEHTVEGAAETWVRDDGVASPSSIVAPGRETGHRAVGEVGRPSATERRDRSTRSTGLWNHTGQSQAMHASRAPKGTTTPESLERDRTSEFANRRVAARRARAGEDADRPGAEGGVGQGGAPGEEGREWLSADPRFDSAPGVTRKEIVAVATPNSEAPRRSLGLASTENSERGPKTQWASAAELSNRTDTSAFDLGAPSARGADGVGAGGRGQSVASQGGHGRAANNGKSASNRAVTTRASRSNPYFYSMYRRIDKNLKFPRKLAIALEQGEVVLRFQLDARGRVLGLVIAKSSDFGEFDAEALRAFRAAGPFGEVPPALLAGRDRLSVIAPYYFRNPLIR